MATDRRASNAADAAAAIAAAAAAVDRLKGAGTSAELPVRASVAPTTAQPTSWALEALKLLQDQSSPVEQQARRALELPR